MSHRLHWPGAATGPLVVGGARFHYLRRVLRVDVGTALEVFDAGRAFTATVTSVDAARESLALELGPERGAPPTRAMTVVQGLPKGDKLELVLQKATELGAAGIAPVSTARSVVKLEGKEDKKLERWRRIVEEAARQCRRSDVPTVHAPSPLAAVWHNLPADVAVLVLDEEEHALPLSAAWASLAPTRPLALVVGPEGGLTREEVDSLTARGATSVTLGRLVLRTETAALAALAVLRHLEGEFA